MIVGKLPQRFVDYGVELHKRVSVISQPDADIKVDRDLMVYHVVATAQVLITNGIHCYFTAMKNKLATDKEIRDIYLAVIDTIEQQADEIIRRRIERN